MSIQFGNYKQAIAKLLLPLTGKMASRLCVQQKKFIDETLKTIFNTTISNPVLKGSLLRRDLFDIKIAVMDGMQTDASRIEIEMCPYYVIWSKFFKKAKHAGLGNPSAVLDPLQVKKFTELYEKKMGIIKDDASLALWAMLSNIPATTFKGLITLAHFRKWMSEEESQQWLGPITSLILKDKKLKVIPEEIKWLPKLKVLCLSGNEIQSFPEDFLMGKLFHPTESHLEEIYFDRNQIQAIPNYIYSLPKIKDVFLQDNQIQTLPHDIVSGETNLRFFLHNNPLPNIPPQKDEPNAVNRRVMRPVASIYH